MFTRISLTLFAALALTAAPSAAHAPTVAGVDDPSTIVGEAARLDTSRVTVVGGGGVASSMDLAREYAAKHGLTSCGSPADAELDDVFLTRNVHPVDGLPYDERIVPADLDTALDSAGKRVVILACSRG